MKYIYYMQNKKGDAYNKEVESFQQLVAEEEGFIQLMIKRSSTDFSDSGL